MKYVMLLLFLLFCNKQATFAQPAKESAQKKIVAAKGLFESGDELNLTLQGNLKTLLRDRDEKSNYHPVTVSYQNAESKEFSLPITVKTRGHFRKLKSNCYYPPLMLKFPKNELQKSTVFKGQGKLKLVMPCRGDEYVINEWMVYQLYNLISPYSFKARLVSVTLVDDENKKSKDAFYAMLLEDEDDVAKRNKMIAVEKKLQPQGTNHETFLKMAVFQYLIGNTDWSVKYQQNIKLLAIDNNQFPHPVPYDFDHAGIVEAPYAEPFGALKMSSIRQRRFRGYCIDDLNDFKSTIAFFNSVKQKVYDLYNNCSLLEDRYKKRTLKYLDEFYQTINNEKAWQKEFAYPCDKNGTGNVVIKGLKE